jgi:hypothetical protein
VKQGAWRTRVGQFPINVIFNDADAEFSAEIDEGCSLGFGESEPGGVGQGGAKDEAGGLVFSEKSLGCFQIPSLGSDRQGEYASPKSAEDFEHPVIGWGLAGHHTSRLDKEGEEDVEGLGAPGGGNDLGGS